MTSTTLAVHRPAPRKPARDAATPPLLPFKSESLPAYVVLQRPRISANGNSNASAGCEVISPPMDAPHIGPTSAMPAQIGHAGPTQQDIASTIATSALHPAIPRALPISISARHLHPPKPPLRASLSDQLHAISQQAQQITQQLQQAHASPALGLSNGSVTMANLDAPCLLAATTVSMSVGRLSCRFPCPVRFQVDRCVYLFQHPFQPKEILMLMRYDDMRDVHLQVATRTLSFRIAHALEQFGDDYNPTNPQHVLRIVMATQHDAEQVKRFITQHKAAFGSTC